jgi:hypothetical protein
VADTRVRWLLGLALVLVALRFAVVPWTQAQVERRQQLEVLTQRLDRSAGVVEDKAEILAAQGRLSKVSTAARAIFPAVDDKERFRLDSQRMLSGIAGRGDVKVTLFDWVVDGEAAKAGLAYGRVNASLQGPLDSLVAVHGQVEGEMPFAAVREVKLETPGSGVSGVAAESATLVLVIDLFYRPAATEPPAPTAAPTTGAGT